MLVLSDEPKALVLAAERLIELSSNIARLYTVDTLAFQLNDYIAELRRSEDTRYIGTAGFYVFIFKDEGVEEVRLMLDVADFYRYDEDPQTQQFVKQDGPYAYDESCPPEWREEDEA